MRTKSIILGTSALVTGLFGAMAAHAQSDEIVITATKREQTLQEVPIAVTVTSGDTIEKAQILDIIDLQTVVPSLRVTQLQASSQTNFVIRGFGNGANNVGIEPSVGVFIDGVYRSRSAASIGDLPKLERVEVLRGPQSTLFGKNASAGVISVATAKPSYETEGYIEGGIGNFNQYLAKGYISSGITENLAFSLGGSYNIRDGYYNNQTGFEDENNRDRYSINGQLLFEPTDNITLRLLADANDISEACCGTTVFSEDPATAGAIRFLGGQLPSENDPFSFDQFNNRESTNEITSSGLSFHADIDLGFANFTSITSKRNVNNFLSTDADFTSLDIIDNVFTSDSVDTFTQEFRLTSPGEGSVDWMVGAFYIDESITSDNGIEYGADTRNYIDLLVAGLTGGALSLGDIEASNAQLPGTYFNDSNFTNELFTQENQAFSLFGNIDWHISDRLTATFGLNYTNDEKDVTGDAINNEAFSQVDLAGQEGANVLIAGGIADNFGPLAAACGLPAANQTFSPANAFALTQVAACGFIPGMPSGAVVFGGLQAQVAAGVGALDLSDPTQNPLLGLTALQFQPQFVAFNDSSSDDETTWTVRLAYDLTDNVNIYASAATGFKATSWNLSRDSRPTTPTVRAGLPLLNAGTRFALPEEALVYEIGLKAKFAQGSINVALFDQSLENFQSNIFNGTGFELGNAEEQSVQGLELEATYQPIEPLTLSFSGTFLDPVYDSFTNSAVGDLSGEQPAGIHEVSISTSATYNHDFGQGLTGYLRGDYLFEDDVQVVDNIPGVDREVNLLNLSGGLDWENGLSASVWIRNATDDQHFLSAFPGVVQLDTVNAYINQPRTYGVNVRYSF